ncbi:Imm72 family immunity protein [Caballeronia sp. AZ10_KS36]|uniref:Imm72 family immunity protein n=1 Tax=Caballeronia sp. AZ10_KS36 TaxID=2921757 RepID=UPI0020298832|nr:Imm72 family immunity protein [Caballeronia sp. AZ10_KS36]
MSAFLYVAGKNDDEARDRAFYLLKKYTSAALLRRAIGQYREFLREFEREIRLPEVKVDYSDDLLQFLRFLQPMEYAEPLLVIPARRGEAFKALVDALDFDAYIWGRRYEELGAADPSDLFYKLGYRAKSEDAVGLFGKANDCSCLLSVALTTIDKGSVLYLGSNKEARSVRRWTYESIFFDDLPSNAVPPIRFPAQLTKCPPPNEDTTGEVWSGRQIPVTGIWEPWSIDPKIGVRCPNYYLAGDIASQYQFEGTDTLEDVRWRLIWKDTRYADGTIPHEERDYFAPPPPVVRNRRLLTARPGEVCPRSGEWFSHHLNRRVTVKAGEPMPGPERGKTGAVIWYLELKD